MSLAPSEMLSQRGSYMGGHNSEMEMRTFDLPSDDAILAEIREILKTADLMTVTKKSIKMELERKFGVNLDAKRAYVNSGMCKPHWFSKLRLPANAHFQLLRLYCLVNYD